MHWNATGRVSRNATTPDHRCNGLAHPGDAATPGSRPHIASALSTWTTTKTMAAVVNHDFMAYSAEKPNVVISAPSPGETRAYPAKIDATTIPRPAAAANPHLAGWLTGLA
jgi:hypothetical protein